MNAKVKMGMFVMGLVALLLLSGFPQVSNASASTTMRKPRYVPADRGFIKDAIKGEFLSFLRNMEDAGFSTGNVLYTTFDHSGNKTFVLNRNSEFSYQLNDLSRLQQFVNGTVQKFSWMNETLTAYNESALATWEDSAFQSHPRVNQSTFNGSYLQFAVSYTAFLIRANLDNGTAVDYDPQSLDDFANFVGNTTLLDRNLLIERYLFNQTDLSLPRFLRVFGPAIKAHVARIDVFSLVDHLLMFFEDLWSELAGKTSLTMTAKKIVDGSMTVTVNAKTVAILYDNDSSLVDALDRIKNNQSVDSQPFTGDEIFTVVDLVTVQEEFNGYYEAESNWVYNDNSSAVLLQRMVRFLARNHQHAPTISRHLGNHIYILRDLLETRHTVVNTTDTGPITDVQGTFSVAQLKINELVLRRQNNNLIPTTFNFTYIEHRMLGTLLYNDTNQNGMLDLGTVQLPDRRTGNPSIVPILSDEALYRVDWKSIGDVQYRTPTTENDVLSMGVTFDQVGVRLVPIHVRPEQARFNESDAVDQQTVDNISIDFKFSIVPENATAKLKFDYVLGEWSNKTALSGLSLNQMYSTAIVDGRGQFRRFEREDGREINATESNATRIHRFKFHESKRLSVDIRLDDIPYLWNGTESVTAIGQLIPLHAGLRMFGQVTQTGGSIAAMAAAAGHRVYLYSVSYPQFSGEEIEHDPTMSVAALSSTSDSESSGETPQNRAPIPGFEVIPFVAGVALLVLTIKGKKRRH